MDCQSCSEYVEGGKNICVVFGCYRLTFIHHTALSQFHHSVQEVQKTSEDRRCEITGLFTKQWYNIVHVEISVITYCWSEDGDRLCVRCRMMSIKWHRRGAQRSEKFNCEHSFPVTSSFHCMLCEQTVFFCQIFYHISFISADFVDTYE